MRTKCVKAAHSQNLADVCAVLYSIAQRHTPSNAFQDAAELLSVSKVLREAGITVETAPKITAAANDYSPAVLKQSSAYRLLRAKFAAALGTIADLGVKTPKRHKSEFHAGVNDGLRKAAKIAIMFLDELNGEMDLNNADNYSGTSTAKSGGGLTR
jgi:hypothetical protein